MKHSFTKFMLLMSLFLITSAASAQEVIVDKILYECNEDGTATITGYQPGLSGELVIPNAISGNGKEYIVTEIESEAFSGCEGLTSVVFPKGLTTIGFWAFDNCPSLEKLSVAEGNQTFDSRENCNAVIKTANNTLVLGCKNSTIPKSVTGIGKGAFTGCTGLTSIDLHENIENIGSNAFQRSGLTSVTLPDGLKAIKNYSFAECTNLASVVFPKKSLTKIGEAAFYGCTSLVSVDLPESLTKLDFEAFHGCSSLTSVNLPSGLTTIKSATFSECSSLSSIEFPSGLTTIEVSAFYECSALTAIDLPSGLTTIEGIAFYGCSGLTSVVIPASVTELQTGAFTGCSSLEKLSVAEGNQRYDSRDNCNAIIETASNTLISGCKNTIIPNSVTGIGNDAFEGCTGLTSIDLPSGLTSIERRAFSGCIGLTSLVLPSSLTTIGNYAFRDCSSLTSIVNMSTEPQTLGDEAFSTETYEKAILHVLPGMEAKYRSAGEWSQFKSIKEDALIVTGIATPNADAINQGGVQKMIQDGRLVIQKEDKKYNAAGVQVK